MNYIDEIKKYKPINAQEESDKSLILELYDEYKDMLYARELRIAHFTSSIWITNKDRTKVLMGYHNLYNNYGWFGGHADKDTDPLYVAKKELEEETGLAEYEMLYDGIISLEILPVPPHVKRGSFVSSHLHLNVTYLFQADESAPIRIKPDENSSLKWVNIDDAPKITNEELMKPVYIKLNERIKQIKK